MSKATGRVAAARMLGRISQPPREDPLGEPEIRRLTHEYLRLRESGESGAVEATIEMGRMIREAKPRLRGHMAQWFREDLHVSKSTASNQQHLAEFADRSPSAVKALETLGVLKLFRVCRLRARGVRLLLGHRIEDLVGMSLRRFTKLTNQHRRAPRRKPGVLLVHQAAARAEKWAVSMQNWRRLKPTDGPALERYKRALDGLMRVAGRLRRRL